MDKPITITSKLPDVGTTIFTVVSAKAEEYGAINLAQGFPNYDCDNLLKDHVSKSLYDGKNQYAPMAGLLALRDEISLKIQITQALSFSPADEITITAGATQALFSAITAFVHPGEEVIIIEPAYDSYAPAIRAVGGIPVYLTTLSPYFTIDWHELRSLIHSNTRMVIINTPGNPSTKIWRHDDFEQLSLLIEGTNIIILSDEVYEHLVYDGVKHMSALSFPALRERTLAVYSFGKTFHSTGWKIGYCIASSELTREFRKVHQFNVFCVSSFVQHGLAAYLRESNTWSNLPQFYQEKRDLLLQLLSKSHLKPVLSEGSFFNLFDYSEISDLNDMDFVNELIVKHKIAAIPLSAFYHRPPTHLRYIRLCFAKTEETLRHGAKLLLNI